MSKKTEIRNIKENLPALKYDERLRCFRYGNGTYMDIYGIIPKDLVNGDSDMIEMDCFTWAKFYKTYGADIQIVSMMFPCDTRKQQEYWKRILKKNENPILEKMIKRKIQELEYRERYTLKKEFFLMCFFESEEELVSGRKTINATLGICSVDRNENSVFQMLEEIEGKKKKQILFRFCNKNCSIW